MNMKRFLGFLVVLFVAVDAWPQGEGIVYTEYDTGFAVVAWVRDPNNPWTEIDEGYISFDIDRDGKDDFSVYMQRNKYGRFVAHLCALGDEPPHWTANYVVSTGNCSNRFTDKASYGEVMSDKAWRFHTEIGSIWENEGSVYCVYMGMKVVHGDSALYGWCELCYRLGEKNYGYVRLVRSAICTIPNYPLRYGQRSTVENFESMDGVRVCKMENGKLLLKSEGLALIKEVIVYNTMGRQVLETSFGARSNQMNVDVGGLMDGVYMVCCVLDDGRRVTNKVLVWNR